ncbi:hypothetical protein D3C71_530690 [compost metagenome]
MKKFNFILSLITLLSISIISCSQGEKYDCENVLKERLYSSHMSKGLHKDSLKRDQEILMECGNLDSVDAKLFSGPFMYLILVDLHNKERKAGKITYKRGLEIISEFKKEWKDEYKLSYTATSAQMELENIKVNLADFERIRPKLIDLGMEKDIETFKTFLEKNRKNWTYGEAMKAFFEAQKQNN